MSDEIPPAPEDSPRPPIEIEYFLAGAKYFTDNRDLLGLTIVELGSDLGELTPSVRRAIDELTIATAERMTDIMRMGPKFFERERST